LTLATVKKIAFIGAGNMATSIIGGLLNCGVSANAIEASDPHHETRERLRGQYGVGVTDDNARVCADADLVVLAVKPQVLKDVCLALREHLPKGCLVVSIAAGINCESLQRWLGERPIVRVMPNTPALVGEGASGYFATALVSAEQKALAKAVLEAVGVALEVESESLIDAVTAVSGSGPAYFFLLMEAMIDAGEKLGLSRATASQLTLKTALGAARLASESDVDVGELRRRVTSPNGTTERAISNFQKNHFNNIVAEALTACAQRGAELADELGK